MTLGAAGVGPGPKTLSELVTEGPSRATSIKGRGLRAFTKGAPLVALVVLIVVVLASLLAPWISPFPPNEIHVDVPLQGPNPRFWLGTDEGGRDLLTRLIYGTGLTLLVAAGSVTVAMAVGTVWGFAAGFGKRWIAGLLMRLVDGALAIPAFLLALLFVASFGSSVAGLIAIIGLLNAPVVARLARSAVLEESATEYVAAAYAAGAKGRTILWREIFPNTMPALLVQASLVTGYAIITEAGLSFLGLGVQPPVASLGSLLLEGYQNLYSAPSYILWPGCVIIAIVWALNTVGDRLRVALDPRASS
jgi:peptide/nickel transport system permease protein